MYNCDGKSFHRDNGLSWTNCYYGLVIVYRMKQGEIIEWARQVTSKYHPPIVLEFRNNFLHMAWFDRTSCPLDVSLGQKLALS